MKISAKFLLLAATCLAFVGSARAQIQTFDTRPTYQGSTFTFTSGSSQGETFTGVYSVASLTYNFFGTTTGDTLTATFGQWTGSSFVAGTTTSFGTITIPSSGSAGWTTIPGASGGPYNTYQVTFDLTDTGTNTVANSDLYTPIFSDVVLGSSYGYLTNPGNTYALMLTDTGGGNNLALGLTNSNVFPGGATNFGFNDWVFANISVSTTNPVPESSTVAAILGIALVAGLVGFRIRQQRQQQLAPVAVQTLA